MPNLLKRSYRPDMYQNLSRSANGDTALIEGSPAGVFTNQCCMVIVIQYRQVISYSYQIQFSLSITKRG